MRPKVSKRVKFTTTLDERLLKTTKIYAINRGKSVNEIIEEALRIYFQKQGVKLDDNSNETKGRESF